MGAAGAGGSREAGWVGGARIRGRGIRETAGRRQLRKRGPRTAEVEGIGAGGGARTGVTADCRGKRGRGTGRGRGTWVDAGRGSAGFGALREACGTGSGGCGNRGARGPGAAGSGGRGNRGARGLLRRRPAPGTRVRRKARLEAVPVPRPHPHVRSEPAPGNKAEKSLPRARPSPRLGPPSGSRLRPPGPCRRCLRIRGAKRRLSTPGPVGARGPAAVATPLPVRPPCVSARQEGPAVVRGRGAEQPVPGEAGAAGEPGKPGTLTRRTARGKGGPEPGAGAGNEAERRFGEIGRRRTGRPGRRRSAAPLPESGQRPGDPPPPSSGAGGPFPFLLKPPTSAPRPRFPGAQ